MRIRRRVTQLAPFFFFPPPVSSFRPRLFRLSLRPAAPFALLLARSFLSSSYLWRDRGKHFPYITVANLHELIPKRLPGFPGHLLGAKKEEKGEKEAKKEGKGEEEAAKKKKNRRNVFMYQRTRTILKLMYDFPSSGFLMLRTIRFLFHRYISVKRPDGRIYALIYYNT